MFDHRSGTATKRLSATCAQAVKLDADGVGSRWARAPQDRHVACPGYRVVATRNGGTANVMCDCDCHRKATSQGSPRTNLSIPSEQGGHRGQGQDEHAQATAPPPNGGRRADAQEGPEAQEAGTPGAGAVGAEARVRRVIA